MKKPKSPRPIRVTGNPSTAVSMKIDGYKDREVMMVTYEFDQVTDVEGQMAGIPRGNNRPQAKSDTRKLPTHQEPAAFESQIIEVQEEEGKEDMSMQRYEILWRGVLL